MQTDLFDFELPPELIALRPARPRDSARLMVVWPSGDIEHRSFTDLGDYVAAGDVLVFNDSRVMAARLKGVRPRRGPALKDVEIELMLHKRLGADRFLAFAKPARRLQVGDKICFSDVTAEVLARAGGEVAVRFDCGGEALDLAIARIGTMPLPPYIANRRAPDAQDMIDYQTVYAAHEGSVAAPTAGLHFTARLLEQLKQEGAVLARVTLHVGPGTFLPVSAVDTAQHVMHSERAILDDKTAVLLNCAHAQGKRIAAVGTTSLRTLESAADTSGSIKAFNSETAIFITPGYKFRAVDMLVTNFHLPRSTLFMLVSALMGLDVMRRAYAEAVANQYRFYSYGDACLLIRPQ